MKVCSQATCNQTFGQQGQRDLAITWEEGYIICNCFLLIGSFVSGVIDALPLPGKLNWLGRDGNQAPRKRLWSVLRGIGDIGGIGPATCDCVCVSLSVFVGSHCLFLFLVFDACICLNNCLFYAIFSPLKCQTLFPHNFNSNFCKHIRNKYRIPISNIPDKKLFWRNLGSLWYVS